MTSALMAANGLFWKESDMPADLSPHLNVVRMGGLYLVNLHYNTKSHCSYRVAKTEVKCTGTIGGSYNDHNYESIK